MDRYELIESFPSSLPKYQVGLIAETLEGTSVNPCDIIHEKRDLRKQQSVDEIVEELAFENSEKLRFFLDVKNHYFKSRRVNSVKLTDYLKREYDYDPGKIREFKDDKNALFVMLFNQTYNPKDNKIKKDKFTEARLASYSFKDRRDRMTNVDYEFDFDKIREEIPQFVQIMNSDIAKTKVDAHVNEGRQIMKIMFRQDKGREVVPRIEVDEDNNVSVTYKRNHPVRETVLKISKEEKGTELKLHSSVSSWDETLMRFFTSTVDRNFTEDLEARESTKTKEIMEEVKEKTEERSDDPEIAGGKVEGIVTDNVEDAVDEIDSEESELGKDFVKSRVESMVVTGVHVDGEETTFELRSENGIKDMIREYEGMSASLAEAVKQVGVDDITIHAKVPSDKKEKDDEVVMENGEWYMSSGGDQSTIKALELVL